MRNQKILDDFGKRYILLSMKKSNWWNLINSIGIIFAIFFSLFSSIKTWNIDKRIRLAEYNRQAWEEYHSFMSRCNKLNDEFGLKLDSLLSLKLDTLSFINRLQELNDRWEERVFPLIKETASKMWADQKVIGQEPKLEAIKGLDEEIHSLKPPSTIARGSVKQRANEVSNLMNVLPPAPELSFPLPGETLYIDSEKRVLVDINQHNALMSQFLERQRELVGLEHELERLTVTCTRKLLDVWSAAMQKD